MKRGAFFDKIEKNPKRLRRLEQEKKDKEFEEKRETILEWKKMVEDGLEYIEKFSVYSKDEQEKYRKAGFQTFDSSYANWCLAPEFFKICVTYLLKNPDDKIWDCELKNEKECEELVFFFRTIGWDAWYSDVPCWRICVEPK